MSQHTVVNSQLVTSSDLMIPPLGLAGTLNMPKSLAGLIVFAHAADQVALALAI